jgi:mannose-6-phosphate isomerase-like protein (cupin superfamily)
MTDLRPAFVLDAGEGHSVWSLGGRFTTKVGSEDSQGRLAVVEALASRETEPPRHIHHREDEAWYILEGAMTFHVGDDVIGAGTGAFIWAPMGVPHTFTVDVEPTRVLVFATPAGFERFADELGSPATSDEMPAGLSMPGPDVLGPVAERYGIEVVGPPVRLA